MDFDHWKRKSCLDRNGLIVDEESKIAKFTYSQLVDFPCLEYLNLCDYENKRRRFDMSKIYSVYLEFAELLKICCDDIYLEYREFIMTKFIESAPGALPLLITKFLRVNDVFKPNSKEAECMEMYTRLSHQILRKENVNPHVLLLLWNGLTITSQNRVRVLARLIYAEDDDNRMYRRRDIRLLEYIIRAAHSINFDFWGASRNDDAKLKGYEFTFCPVSGALVTGSIEQMNILLQHGFTPNCQRTYSYDVHCLFLFSFVSTSTYEIFRQPFAEREITRRSTIYEVLLFLLSLFRNNVPTRLNMILCFRLVWNNILTLPFVTMEELSRECYNLCRLPGIIVTGEEFSECLRAYPLLLSPDNINILEPRSLQYLSRCAIRSHLQKCLQLPHGISQLNLPELMKSYIHVEGPSQ